VISGAFLTCNVFARLMSLCARRQPLQSGRMCESVFMQRVRPFMMRKLVV
jgi:hypothetical protein